MWVVGTRGLLGTPLRAAWPHNGDFPKPLERKSANALDLDSEFFLFIVVLFIAYVSSDLDWAVFEPDLLVTSSVDTYIYIWDIK